MKHAKGDKVRAKWPGSSKYFLGTVLKVDNDKCEVKFDEGTVYSVLVKNIYKEFATSPVKKSTNSMSDHSPSRKSSVERSTMKPAIERLTRRSSMERSTRKPSAERTTRQSLVEQTTRKSSMERSARKSSAERSMRKSSAERSTRKSSAERSTLRSSVERSTQKSFLERSTRKSAIERLPKPAERSPSRTASKAVPKSFQQSANRSAVETQEPSPGRLKSTPSSKLPAVIADVITSSSFELSSEDLATKEVTGGRNSPFIGSIGRQEDQTKEVSDKLGSTPSRSESSYEFNSVKSFLSQVSARRSLRTTGTPVTSTPVLPTVASRTTTSRSAIPASLGLVQRPVLTNGSFSDDEEGLSEHSEHVVTTSVVKEIVEESFEERRPSMEPPNVASAVELLHTIRESSVLRDSVTPERPRQWSLDPSLGPSARLRESVRRSIVREVDSNSVHGSVSGGRDYADLLFKRDGRVVPFIPPDYMEWGGRVGCALWILLLPIALLALHLHCDQVSCELSWRELNLPLAWQVYLDPIAVATVLGFVSMQAVLSVLPVGYQVELIPNYWISPKYRCNGLLSAAVSLAVVCALKYFGFSLSAITSRYFQLLVASLLFSMLLSVVLYVRGAQPKLYSANPYVRSRGFVYSFWAGREVYPQLWHLHVKALLYKISLVGSLVLSLALLMEGVDWSQGHRPPTLMVCTAMLWLYLLDSLWFEDGALTSFSMLYEGCGYMMAMLHCVYPFLATLPLRYHLLHRPELSVYTLVLLSTIFLIGFVLYRSSNSQKDKFRRNPLDPAIAHLETIPMTVPRARKLLVSSYWGFVRHPNYLGDIIMHLALAGTCGVAPALPFAWPLCLLVVLLHRASRDSARCAHRYGSDWKRYCSAVNYRVIPYVY